MNLATPLISPPSPAPHKTRCRPITPGDFEALSGLLASGFPETSREIWATGLARMATMPAVEGMPRFGYLLESDGKAVGVLLLISSRRGARAISNISSWYVDPAFRAHSALLVAMATKSRDVTYLNISPAPHTWPLIEAQGFARYNEGRSFVFPVFSSGGGRINESVPGNLRERELLLAHRHYGCLSFVCEKGEETSPFVLRPRRFRRLKIMELIYCRSSGNFITHAGAIGRFLLRRGFIGVICDGKMPGLAGHYVPGKEPRYFKGAAPTLNDLAFTERVIFGT